ncbi:MAG: hypothetical protein ABI740_01945 [Alphaproteobacteria bacterium]
MKAILFLVVLVIAAGGAYVSRPHEADLKAHLNGLFADMAEKQAKAFDIKNLVKGAVTGVARVDTYKDFYVLTQLSTSADDKLLATCWGVYSQILCEGPTVKAADAK